MCNSSSSVLVLNRTSPSLLHTFVAYTTQLSIAIQHTGNSFLHQHIPRKRLRASSCFNRDTVEFASRKKDESNPRIKTPPPFLKNITKESDLENFQDLIVALDACYWFHKTISISFTLSRFGGDRAI